MPYSNCGQVAYSGPDAGPPLHLSKIPRRRGEPRGFYQTESRASALGCALKSGDARTGSVGEQTTSSLEAAPSPLIQERQWLFRTGHWLTGLVQRVHDPLREPLWRKVKQGRGDVPMRHGFIRRVEDPQFLSGIGRLFSWFYV